MCQRIGEQRHQLPIPDACQEIRLGVQLAAVARPYLDTLRAITQVIGPAASRAGSARSPYGRQGRIDDCCRYWRHTGECIDIRVRHARTSADPDVG